MILRVISRLFGEELQKKRESTWVILFGMQKRIVFVQ